MTSALAVFAADAAHAQRYLVRTYGEFDSVANSWISDIAQTADGRMWFLTRSELLIYDGTEWERIDVPLEHLGLARIRVDSRDRPWIMDGSGGLATPGAAGSAQPRWKIVPSFRSLSPEADFDVTVLEGPGGPQPVLAAVRGGLWRFDGEQWRAASEAFGFAERRIYAVEHLGRRMVLGTDEGLIEIDGSSVDRGLQQRLGLPAGAVLGLAAESSDADSGHEGLWVVGDGWIARAGSAAQVPEVLTWNTGLLPTGRVARVAADRQGGLFLGDEDALLYASLDDRAVRRFGVEQGLPCEGSTALLLDREGSLWIGSRMGLSRLTSRRFASFDARHGLSEDEVSSILQLDSGEIVMGHNGGLTFYDGSTMRRMPIRRASPEPTAHGRVLSLCADGGSGFFLAAWGNGLGHWSGDGPIEWLDAPAPWLTRLSSVLRTEEGSLWVGGQGGALELDEDLTPIPGSTGLQCQIVRTLAQGEDGTLYAAAAIEGLYCRHRGAWRLARNGEGGRWNDTFTVLPARDGRVWVGSKLGVELLEDGRLVRPAQPELRFEHAVFAIFEDARDRLWLGTSDGAYVWDGRTLEHFCVENGLAGHEVNRAACMVDRKGQIWLGTDRGVSLFQERFDHVQRPPPAAEVRVFDLAGSEIEPGADLALAPGQDSLSMHARAVTFLDERRVCWRYRLEGFDTRWLESRGGTRFETRYTSLPPGRYRFQIQARAVEGPWGPVATTPVMSIARPQWQRPWFLGLSTIGLAAAGWILFREVTQRRYAERLEREVGERTRELSESRAGMAREKERLAATLASIADGVIAVDGAGRVAMLNRAAEGLLGWSDHEARERSIDEVLVLDRADGTRVGTAELCGALGTELGLRGRDMHLSPRAGESREVELSIAPLLQRGGEPAGAVIALQDVTERRRMEGELARAQRLESLGVLAGGIAHDFNNVLTAAGGYVGLLELEIGEALGAAPLLRSAKRALARAGELSQQLLTFARGGAPVRAPAALNELVEAAAQLAFIGSSVRWQIDLPDGLWPIDVDKSQVQQVFENLMINARQAMTAGGRVLVRARNVEAGSDELGSLAPARYVRVDVEDSGPGIAQEHLEHVFDPFFTTKPGGTGLGLATAYSIARRHGGAIVAQSQEGSGTIFSVFLPYSARAPEQPRAARPQRPDWKGRALVLDDELSVRAVLRAYLERMGWSVIAVEATDRAVVACHEARAGTHPFDIAFLDLTIPGGPGGAEAAALLSREVPEVALVAMSGYSEDAVLANPRAHGFRATLAKPFRLEDVERVIAELAPAERAPA